MTRASKRRGRRTARVLIIAGAFLAAGAAAATAVGFTPFSQADTGDGDGSELPPATAEVVRETLVDSSSVTGELGYGTAETLGCKLTGTITAIADAGDTVKRGEAVYYVDDLPVVLMYGSLPAYRALAPGLTGDDVEQLEKNLSKLGYDGFTVDATYSESTAAAVREWQEDLGLTETGTVDLGRVVFAPGAMRVEGQEAAIGDAAQPGGSVLTYTGTDKVVTVEVDVEDADVAAEGDTVSVRLPSGQADGEISSIRTFIDPGDGQSTEPATMVRITVTIDDEEALKGLDQASVKVEFTATQREDVLTVPVAALLALADGEYGVEVVEGSATRIVPVETGLFADGKVEVSGEGLSEGMLVGIPS